VKSRRTKKETGDDLKINFRIYILREGRRWMVKVKLIM
jgi:hypothetical protein